MWMIIKGKYSSVKFRPSKLNKSTVSSRLKSKVMEGSDSLGRISHALTPILNNFTHYSQNKQPKKYNTRKGTLNYIFYNFFIR